MGRHFSHRHESATADIARRINSRQQPNEVERVVLNALAADIRLGRTTTVKLTSQVRVLFWKKQYCGGAAMAESLAKGWRPLEPDAGNAAEGSEGSDAGLAISAMRATAHGFLFYECHPE